MMIADTLSCLERTCLAGAVLNSTLSWGFKSKVSTKDSVLKDSELFVSGFLYELPPERLELLTKLFGKVAKREQR